MTLQLTNAGLNALLRAMSGDKIIFSSVQIGNGDPQDVSSATGLGNPLKTLTITKITVNSNNATLETSFNNSDVEAGFRLKEVGIFAQNQDDATEEILYAYGTEPEATADYIAASSGSILETQMEFSIFVGNAENISAIINESLAYATKAAFEAHVGDKGNPHGVTKEQVGLDNVPNVATNDQTPTYSEAKNLVALSSGEKLSVAFGKLGKAVASLIAHIKNVDNPHEVTAKQVKAAEEKHSHTAADITKGTLSVQRGGTGKSSWVANQMVYAQSASALGTIAASKYASGLLRQRPNEAPYWGPVSVTGSYVGTGGYGSDNPNSLTFDDGELPNIIVITAQNRNFITLAVLFPYAGRGITFNDSDGNGSPAYRLEVSISGKTVSWYSPKSSALQANNYNITFVWHALCK